MTESDGVAAPDGVILYRDQEGVVRDVVRGEDGALRYRDQEGAFRDVVRGDDGMLRYRDRDDYTVFHVVPGPDGVLRYRDQEGVLREGPLTIGRTLPQRGRLETREVTVGRSVMLQRRVPTDLGRYEPDAYERVDAEARALCRLVQVYPEPPPRLPRIRGYNMDVAEPFVLVARPQSAGTPATAAAKQLAPNQQVQFQRGLLRVVHYLQQARLEHNEISLDALDWDGADVRLVTFERAVVRGGGPPTGVDLQAATVAIRRLVLGPNAPADTSRDPVALLDLLRGSNEPDPSRRPPVEVLLERLHAAGETPHAVDPARDYREGHYEFDRRTARKFGRPEPPRPSPGGSGAPGTGATYTGPTSTPTNGTGATRAANEGSGVAVGERREPETVGRPGHPRQWGVVLAAVVVVLFAIVAVAVLVVNGGLL